MREELTTRVSPGETLQVHSSRGPIGHRIVVPEGIHSVVVVFRGRGEETKTSTVVALADVMGLQAEKEAATAERTEKALPEFWNWEEPKEGLA